MNELFQSDSDMMGIRMQERDVFVVVNYDFEYITEEGKEVWMKEGEVLLLLSRTNSDWWQVKKFFKTFLIKLNGSISQIKCSIDTKICHC